MTVYRPTHARTLPDNVVIQTERQTGRKCIEINTDRGRKAKAYLTADGKKYLQEQKKWAGSYKDHCGKRRRISLCTDKTASELALGELRKNMELLMAGRSLPPVDRIAHLIREPIIAALEATGQAKKAQRLSKQSIIDVHLEDYITHLESKGTKAQHRKEVKRCIKTIVEDCGFRTPADIALRSVEQFVIKKKNADSSDRTVNVYTDTLRYFVRWAIERGILEENPLVGLKRRDEKTNRVREARPLTPDEIEMLLEVAYKRPLECRQGQKLSVNTINKLRRLGEERRLIYSIMLYTGLRLDETRLLTWADVVFEVENPYLTVRAKVAKNSKSTTLPLHEWLVSLLKDWKAKNPQAIPTDRIAKVPSTLLKVLNRDLEWAGIEKTIDGKTVHLHACRHSFVTMLARKGIQPHIVKRLARHSKTDMTMSVYTHIIYGDENLAIGALPIPQAKAEITEILATGTDNSQGGVQNGVHSVRKGVHNGVHTTGLTKDKTSPIGNSQQHPHQIVLNHKSLKTSALSNKKTSLSPIDNKVLKMGGIGLEPTTSCVSSRRSNQLS
jgi:integrase